TLPLRINRLSIATCFRSWNGTVKVATAPGASPRCRSKRTKKLIFSPRQFAAQRWQNPCRHGSPIRMWESFQRPIIESGGNGHARGMGRSEIAGGRGDGYAAAPPLGGKLDYPQSGFGLEDAAGCG